MGDSCSILLAFVVVTLLVAVIGHAIWLGLAALYRAITGKSSIPKEQFFQPILNEDSITSKRLQQLYRDGLIDLPTFQTILKALNQKTAINPPIVPLANRPTQPPAPPPIPPFADAQDQPLAPPTLPRPRIQFQPQIPLPPPRQVLPIESFPPPPPPRPPRPPRKPFSEIFKRFMEESNIRWGELIGGLLIIGCSIALVLTFWEQIATQPWLRFFLFTAVTSALFGTGLYTEHRWKLPTTSRGLLLIATLLVPLNFLAFSRGGATSSALAQ